MAESARNYSVTELELCGLVFNIASCSSIKKVDCEAIVGPLALTRIIECRTEQLQIAQKWCYGY